MSSPSSVKNSLLVPDDDDSEQTLNFDQFQYQYPLGLQRTTSGGDDFSFGASSSLSGSGSDSADFGSGFMPLSSHSMSTNPLSLAMPPLFLGALGGMNAFSPMHMSPNPASYPLTALSSTPSRMSSPRPLEPLSMSALAGTTLPEQLQQGEAQQPTSAIESDAQPAPVLSASQKEKAKSKSKAKKAETEVDEAVKAKDKGKTKSDQMKDDEHVAAELAAQSSRTRKKGKPVNYKEADSDDEMGIELDDKDKGKYKNKNKSRDKDNDFELSSSGSESEDIEDQDVPEEREEIEEPPVKKKAGKSDKGKSRAESPTKINEEEKSAVKKGTGKKSKGKNETEKTGKKFIFYPDTFRRWVEDHGKATENSFVGLKVGHARIHREAVIHYNKNHSADYWTKRVGEFSIFGTGDQIRFLLDMTNPDSPETLTSAIEKVDAFFASFEVNVSRLKSKTENRLSADEEEKMWSRFEDEILPLKYFLKKLSKWHPQGFPVIVPDSDMRPFVRHLQTHNDALKNSNSPQFLRFKKLNEESKEIPVYSARVLGSRGEDFFGLIVVGDQTVFIPQLRKFQQTAIDAVITFYRTLLSQNELNKIKEKPLSAQEVQRFGVKLKTMLLNRGNRKPSAKSSKKSTANSSSTEYEEKDASKKEREKDKQAAKEKSKEKNAAKKTEKRKQKFVASTFEAKAASFGRVSPEGLFALKIRHAHIINNAVFHYNSTNPVKVWTKRSGEYAVFGFGDYRQFALDILNPISLEIRTATIAQVDAFFIACGVKEVARLKSEIDRQDDLVFGQFDTEVLPLKACLKKVIKWHSKGFPVIVKNSVTLIAIQFKRFNEALKDPNSPEFVRLKHYSVSETTEPFIAPEHTVKGLVYHQKKCNFGIVVVGAQEDFVPRLREFEQSAIDETIRFFRTQFSDAELNRVKDNPLSAQEEEQFNKELQITSFTKKKKKDAPLDSSLKSKQPLARASLADDDTEEKQTSLSHASHTKAAAKKASDSSKSTEISEKEKEGKESDHANRGMDLDVPAKSLEQVARSGVSAPPMPLPDFGLITRQSLQTQPDEQKTKSRFRDDYFYPDRSAIDTDEENSDDEQGSDQISLLPYESLLGQYRRLVREQKENDPKLQKIVQNIVKKEKFKQIISVLLRITKDKHYILFGRVGGDLLKVQALAEHTAILLAFLNSRRTPETGYKAHDINFTEDKVFRLLLRGSSTELASVLGCYHEVDQFFVSYLASHERASVKPIDVTLVDILTGKVSKNAPLVSAPGLSASASLITRALLGGSKSASGTQSHSVASVPQGASSKRKGEGEDDEHSAKKIRLDEEGRSSLLSTHTAPHSHLHMKPPGGQLLQGTSSPFFQLPPETLRPNMGGESEPQTQDEGLSSSGDTLDLRGGNSIL